MLSSSKNSFRNRTSQMKGHKPDTSLTWVLSELDPIDLYLHAILLMAMQRDGPSQNEETIDTGCMNQYLK